MKRSLLLLLMVTFLGMAGACNFESAEYQQELLSVLSHKYDTEKINMKLADQELIVTFINSPLEDLSTKEKQEIAQEIGALALSPENRPKLVKGKLVFKDNTELGVVKYSDSQSFDMQLDRN